MPSLLKKIFHPSTGSGRNQNPYISPHHPNHPKTSQSAPTSMTASQTFSTSQSQTSRNQRPHLASPREQHDFLAEAREASGRDRITGQRRHQIGHASNGEREERRTEQSVYQETNEEDRLRTRGTKYDLFVQEMKARKEGRWRAPDGGFYAPERQLGEYYQPENGGGRNYGRRSGI